MPRRAEFGLGATIREGDGAEVGLRNAVESVGGNPEGNQAGMFTPTNYPVGVGTRQKIGPMTEEEYRSFQEERAWGRDDW